MRQYFLQEIASNNNPILALTTSKSELNRLKILAKPLSALIVTELSLKRCGKIQNQISKESRMKRLWEYSKELF